MCVYINIYVYALTATDASRAATARISAHDTIPGHILSNCDFASSMTSNPLTELLFCGAICSVTIEDEFLSKIDASHP